MQMKMPIILSNSSYAKKLNDQYDFALIVDPENEEEIANAITELKEDSSICRRKGMNGFNLVKDQLNWAAEEKKLLDLYIDVLG